MLSPTILFPRSAFSVPRFHKCNSSPLIPHFPTHGQPIAPFLLIHPHYQRNIPMRSPMTSLLIPSSGVTRGTTTDLERLTTDQNIHKKLRPSIRNKGENRTFSPKLIRNKGQNRTFPQRSNRNPLPSNPLKTFVGLRVLRVFVLTPEVVTTGVCDLMRFLLFLRALREIRMLLQETISALRENRTCPRKVRKIPSKISPSRHRPVLVPSLKGSRWTLVPDCSILSIRIERSLWLPGGFRRRADFCGAPSVRDFYGHDHHPVAVDRPAVAGR